ncbi:hypothetical protein BHM03_00029147 [Ensete ventricosum]|nr:hypothetical protein BHM03_00029147 [Ensete ventricosum]
MNAFAVACDEMRPAFPFADRKTPVFCPKPRRLSPLAGIADPVRPPRWRGRSSSFVAAILLRLAAKPYGQPGRPRRTVRRRPRAVTLRPFTTNPIRTTHLSQARLRSCQVRPFAGGRADRGF